MACRWSRGAIFRSAGYEIIDLPQRSQMSDRLAKTVFETPPQTNDEVIIATTSRDLLPVIVKIRLASQARRPHLGRGRKLAGWHPVRR